MKVIKKTATSQLMEVPKYDCSKKTNTYMCVDATGVYVDDIYAIILFNSILNYLACLLSSSA